MAVDAGWLFGFLEEVSANLDRPVTLVAVGGTALTLLGVKESTLDIDFTAPKDDLVAFHAGLLPHRHRHGRPTFRTDAPCPIPPQNQASLVNLRHPWSLRCMLTNTTRTRTENPTSSSPTNSWSRPAASRNA
jgi:hypothetical protein